MIGASLVVLTGCAGVTSPYYGGLSQADQARIEQEVSASRNAAKNDFTSYANVCLENFPDAHSIGNDGGNHLSEQGSVNIELVTGSRKIVCSVGKETKQVERIHTGSQAMSLTDYKATPLSIIPVQPSAALADAQADTASIPSPAAPTPPVQAQASSDILLEACNNIKESAKRLECLKAIPKTAATPEASAKDEVRRTFTDLNSILNAGTSYNSYSSQLESVAKALGRYQASAQSEVDRKSAALLAEALEAHKDAQLFWQRDISWYARASNKTAYPGGLPIEYTGTGYLVPKYNLATYKSDFWGFSQGLPRAQTLRSIWQYADSKASVVLK